MTDDLQQKMAAIADAVRKGRYRYTIHGAQQRIARGVRRHEIEETIYNGEIIEDYPRHHYGPACLVFGRTSEGRALHILCAIQPAVGIITVYDPDQKEWKSDLKTRRRML